MRTDSARLYFTLSHNQLINNVIPIDVYLERLKKLKSLISPSTALYGIIGDILEILDKDAIANKRDIDWETHRISNSANANDGILQLIQICKVSDNDPFPSIPHIHDTEQNLKIDVYTGKCSNGDILTKKELIELWENESFIRKLKNNRETIEKGSATRN